MLRFTLPIFIFAGSSLFLFPEVTFSQGETTSAITGQVSDETNAAIPGASVTITNRENRLAAILANRRPRPFQFPSAQARYLLGKSRGRRI